MQQNKETDRIPDGYQKIQPPEQPDPLNPFRNQRLAGSLFPGEAMIGGGPQPIIVEKKPPSRLIDRLRKRR